jgi:hypothetical protein
MKPASFHDFNSPRNARLRDRFLLCEWFAENRLCHCLIPFFGGTHLLIS